MNTGGEIIAGRYEIAEKIGEGSFGDTYRAIDRTFDCDVVIKIAHSARDQAAIDRLRKEALILSQIRAPQVVRYIDVGSLPDGRPFLVLDHIKGMSAQSLISLGQLSLPNALAIAEAVASGLAAAHAIGVIHRDITPSNVIVPSGPEGLAFDRAIIVDFGVMGELERETQMTRAGQIFGTPYFMSPEQFRGERQSPAADVYGLGAILFAMIYGEPPFRADSATATIVMSLRDEVVIPSTPHIPDQMRSFLKRCLSKNPESRPKSGQSLIEEIRMLRRLDDAGPDTVLVTTASYGSKRFKACLSVGAALAAFIALVVVGWMNPYQSRGIAIGLLLAIAGIVAGIKLPKLFAKRRTQIELDATEILQGTKERMSLSKSIAIEVDQLIARVKRLDERILAKTLAVMLEEYEAAVDSQNRQAALMNVAQLLERLMPSLSPWYVRHDRALSFAVSLVGVLSGAAAIITSIVNILRGK